MFRPLLRGRPDFPVLRRTTGPGRVTVLDMLGAADLDDYDRRARAWAASVWETWSAEHERIRATVRAAL